MAYMTKEEFKQNSRNFQITWNEESNAYSLTEDNKRIDGIAIESQEISDLEKRIMAIMKVDHTSDIDKDGEMISFISAHTITYKL